MKGNNDDEISTLVIVEGKAPKTAELILNSEFNIGIDHAKLY